MWQMSCLSPELFIDVLTSLYAPLSTPWRVSHYGKNLRIILHALANFQIAAPGPNACHVRTTAPCLPNNGTPARRQSVYRKPSTPHNSYVRVNPCQLATSTQCHMVETDRNIAYLMYFKSMNSGKVDVCVTPLTGHLRKRLGSAQTKYKRALIFAITKPSLRAGNL